MPKSRRDRQVERARQDILSAAARVFARHGYRGATIAEIAREADYTPPTLYAYFKKKQDIADSLIAATLQLMVRPLDAPVPDGLSLRARLTLLLRGFDRMFEDHHEAVRAVFRLHTEGIGAGDIPQVHAMFFQRLTAWFQANSSPDESRYPPEVLACVLFGLSQGYEMRWTIEMGPDDDPVCSPISGRSQEFLDIFFNGVAP